MNLLFEHFEIFEFFKYLNFKNLLSLRYLTLRHVVLENRNLILRGLENMRKNTVTLNGFFFRKSKQLKNVSKVYIYFANNITINHKICQKFKPAVNRQPGPARIRFVKQNSL